MSDFMRVRVTAVDGFVDARTFKTLAGAQKFAARHVTETPEISMNFHYAVSPDGVVKLTSTVPMLVLFPKCAEDPAPATPKYDDDGFLVGPHYEGCNCARCLGLI